MRTFPTKFLIATLKLIIHKFKGKLRLKYLFAQFLFSSKSAGRIRAEAKQSCYVLTLSPLEAGRFFFHPARLLVFLL